MIAPCNNPKCKHPFQDKTYNGKRVFNPTAAGSRCTVCGTEHTHRPIALD